MPRPTGSTKSYYSLLPKNLPIWFAHRENYLLYAAELRRMRAGLKQNPGDSELCAEEVECATRRTEHAYFSNSRRSDLHRDWRLTASRYSLTDLESLIPAKVDETIHVMLGNWIDDLRMLESPTLTEREAGVLLARIAATRKRLGVPADVEIPV